MFRRFLLLGALALVLPCACSGGQQPGGGDGGALSDGGDGGALSDGGDGGGMPVPDGMSASHCPTVVLSTTLPLVYEGNTVGKANLFESSRLEWGADPDDALLFVAPEAGTYQIELTKEPSTNQGWGVSVQTAMNPKYYDESRCPMKGQVATVDGVFVAATGSPGDVTLTQGQHLLMLVSSATWSSVKAGAYTLTLRKK